MADWNQIYGLNKGSAQVIQGNPGLDLLSQISKQHQQDKINRQKEDADFSANLAKMNFKGARDADFGELTKQYNDILNTHAQMRASSDPNQKLQLQQQLQQKMQGALYSASQSAEHNQYEQKLADLRLNPNAQLADDYYKNLSEIQKQPSIGNNYSTYQQTLADKTQNLFDKPYDLGTKTKKIFSDLTYDASKSDTKVPLKGGGDQVMHTKATATDPLDYQNRIAEEAKNDKGFLKAVIKTTGEADPALAIQKYAKDTYDVYNKDNKAIKTYGAMNKPDNYYSHLAARQQYADANKKEDAPTYFQDLSEKMRTGVPGSGEEFNQWIGTNPEYGQGIHINTNNPKAVTITIPAKYKFNGQGGGKDDSGNDITDKNAKRSLVKPAYTVTLDSTNPEQWTAGFAKIYKDVTGEPINLSKAQTIYGKGRVPGGMSSTTNKTPIKLTKGSLNNL